MNRMTRLLLAGVALLYVATAAVAADRIVSLYVGNKLVNAEPAARVRDGVTYVPLRAAAEAAGAEVKWNTANQTVEVCAPGRCVLPIKTSRGITVNGGLLIPVRLLGQALGRPVTYDAKAQAVRVK